MQAKNFIIFSTADWNNPFWTNKQHTADNLASRGHKVLYIESLGLRAPTLKTQDLSRIFKRILSFFKGARQVKSNIWVYSPLVIPLHRFKFIRLINSFLLKSILNYYKCRLGLKEAIVWTYNPIVLDLMKSLNPKNMIYHAVDDLSAAPGMDSELITKEELKLTKEVDIIFCTSQKLYQRFNHIDSNKLFYFSNVVDFEHFSKARNNQTKPKDLENIKKPIIGFIGAISEYKLDIKLIKASALKRPDISWVLIGKVGEGQPMSSIDDLREIPNIHLLGPKDYKDLPTYLHFFDVCTIPAPINDYTQSMFPMKYYEYMAAGKPIIASDIDSLKENKECHYFYRSFEEFIKLLDEALTCGVKNKDKCDQLARENTWSKRLDKMLKVI